MDQYRLAAEFPKRMPICLVAQIMCGSIGQTACHARCGEAFRDTLQIQNREQPHPVFAFRRFLDPYRAFQSFIHAKQDRAIIRTVQRLNVPFQSGEGIRQKIPVSRQGLYQNAGRIISSFKADIYTAHASRSTGPQPTMARAYFSASAYTSSGSSPTKNAPSSYSTFPAIMVMRTLEGLPE